MEHVSGQQMEVVYGLQREDELVLVPTDTARFLAALREALTEAKTWGEFKSRAPEGAYTEVMEILAENDGFAGRSGVPAAGAPFEPGVIWGYDDGDWPLFPAQHMLDWLPEDLQERYGQVVDTVFNGPYLEIDPAHTAELIAAMEARGYRCSEDTDLVRRATGV